MKLREIITSRYLYNNSDVNQEEDIAHVRIDSRRVKVGDLFIALPSVQGGVNIKHMTQALKQGAKAIVVGGDVDIRSLKEQSSPDVSWVVVENSRQEAALIASRVYGGQPSINVAVTGTNGKTSVADFVRQIWSLSGHNAISIGTLGVVGEHVDSADFPQCALTTPDSFALHESLAIAMNKGVTHSAIEASSHGIDQHRLDGVKFSAGAFTNLTHEHLDYHGSMQAYFSAKRKLFEEVLPQGETAVLNADESHFSALQNTCLKRGIRVISYGAHQDADLQIEDHRIDGNDQTLSLKIFQKHHKVRFPLVGRFQVYNALCALGLEIATSPYDDYDISVLEKLKSVPGRLELVGYHPDGGTVYVDYAHTPGALETALLALKPHVKGLLSVVFGCGGDRDKLKRPMMGEIAMRLAERVVITDDNPRTESAEVIRSEIKKTCFEAKEIADRKEAIEYAIKNLGRYDSLLIAGKGHEQGQIIGDKTIPFDDRQIAKDLLKEMGGKIT